MTTHAHDWKTYSLLITQPTDRREVLGGIGATIGVPALFALAGLIFIALQGYLGERPPPKMEPLPVMQTRFVRLGRPQARALPTAEPAAQTTKADTPPEQKPQVQPTKAVVPAQAQPVARKPQREEKSVDAEDSLEQLNKSADAISKLSRASESEGDLEGIASGTVSREEADIYLGKLYEFFRNGWEVPTSLSDMELQRLVCTVEVTITEDGRVGEYQISRESGSDAFDQSVLRRLEQTLAAPLPPPPKDAEAKFFGQTISLRFFGKNARQ